LKSFHDFLLTYLNIEWGRNKGKGGEVSRISRKIGNFLKEFKKKRPKGAPLRVWKRSSRTFWQMEGEIREG